MKKENREKARERIVKEIYNYFLEKGEDIGFFKSNKLTFPIVEGEEEGSVEIAISIPIKDSEEEGNDCYSKRKAYEIELRKKAEKVAKAKKKEE